MFLFSKRFMTLHFPATSCVCIRIMTKVFIWWAAIHGSIYRTAAARTAAICCVMHPLRGSVITGFYPAPFRRGLASCSGPQSFFPLIYFLSSFLPFIRSSQVLPVLFGRSGSRCKLQFLLTLIKTKM